MPTTQKQMDGEPSIEPQVADVSTPSSLVTLRKPTSHAHHDWWALALGIIAVPLSGFAFLPGVIPSSPSAACGLIAVGLAMLVWTQARAGSLPRIRSAAGGLAALIALMAGPLIFAPWGNAYRDRQSVRATQLHLELIGHGLQRHLEDLGAYPIGGTRITDAQGRRRGGHGWMTHLLPYIDNSAVYNRIHLDLPYDDPANRPALGTPIETYFSADGDRRLIANVFAASHYAGVGGTVVTTRGEELGAGIFDLGRAYREGDLVDGLANTWIVGEIPGGYPPWGDPENWRSVKKGINRDPEGFGNVAGTGAMCLFADGSVRFLSNKTDVDLLRRLSTRDGHDLSD
ncbi:MAG: hypothetical protein B7Z55_14820 [Planctomycetales bacterium 12-60-4]|nr:MAG: hypothetical protein B7Z55_14820 [Planctomycetales bacterium 12-60-4]